jgi:glycosyltransferase involved in cell wall biosynthesis
MKNNPVVSVIVAAYNAEAYLSECLGSILEQTYPYLEIAVIDDGSTDRTSRIAARYHPRVRCYSQANAGPAAARNLGMMKTSGAYICFLDADDLMTGDRVFMQVDLLERNAEVGIVFCDYKNFDDQREWHTSHFETCNLLMRKMNNEVEVILRNAYIDLAKENFGIAGNFLFRRSLLEKEAGFDSRLRGSEDFHFYYRLARHSPVAVVKRLGMKRRIHNANATSNRTKMTVGALLAWSDLLASETDPLANALLKKRIALFWAGLARYFADEGRYIGSYCQEWRALRSDFCFERMTRSLRSFTRTTLMALGVHRPREPL